MKIGFFQEYTSKDVFSPLKHINFPINLYIGCKNVKQFLSISIELRKKYKNIEKVIYWPILKLSEGYWLSGFAKQPAIRRVTREINFAKESFPVLWDAELPSLNKKLLFTEIPLLLKNLIIIYKALLKQKPSNPIIVAEFPRFGISNVLSIIGGATFPFTKYHRLDMLYSSFLKITHKEIRIRNIIRSNILKYKKYTVGVGLIGRDKNDPTPLLTLKEFDRDMKICKDEGVKEVVLYRLSGMNGNYLRILKKYT